MILISSASAQDPNGQLQKSSRHCQCRKTQAEPPSSTWEHLHRGSFMSSGAALKTSFYLFWILTPSLILSHQTK